MDNLICTAHSRKPGLPCFLSLLSLVVSLIIINAGPQTLSASESSALPVSEGVMIAYPAKMQDRMRLAKQEKDNLYFAVSSLPLSEQELIAKEYIARIQSFDRVSPWTEKDHYAIYENLVQILKKAPDTQFAQIVHWKIRFYYQGIVDTLKNWLRVQECLETYLYKYPSDEAHRDEALDVLVVAASRTSDHEAILYYSELYLRRNPDHMPMLLQNARALKALGDNESARTKLEIVIQKGQGTPAGLLAEDLLKEMRKN